MDILQDLWTLIVSNMMLTNDASNVPPDFSSIQRVDCVLLWILNDRGQCLSCYPGYSLINSNCVVSSNQQPSDANCRTFDPSGNCLACYTSFILTNGRCRAVNPQCRFYDQNGGCTDCYAGYTLKGT